MIWHLAFKNFFLKSLKKLNIFNIASTYAALHIFVLGFLCMFFLCSHIYLVGLHIYVLLSMSILSMHVYLVYQCLSYQYMFILSSYVCYKRVIYQTNGVGNNYYC